jgi:hypothetical protein
MLTSLTIQYLIVGVIVATAAVLLAIRASKYFLPAKGRSNCDTGCGGCAGERSGQTAKLIQLGSPQKK